MAKVTPGFKLYLYQLLSRELGVGKQTLLPQVEDVLVADDIIPQDLECESIQELADACPDFLKVTIFKKGRVYVTVLANDEWDQMLAAPPEKPAAKKAPAGGPKTWKKKKGGKKSIKPVKPGKQRRDREAAEAREAQERAEREREEQERMLAESQAAHADEPLAETPETDAPLPAEEPVDSSEPADAEVPVAPATPVDTAPQAASDADRPVARTLAEILAEARAEEMANASVAAQEEEERPSDEQPEPASPEPTSTIAEPTLEEPPSDPTSEEHPSPAPVPPEPSDADDKPAPEVPAAPEPEPISLTITYDPYEDMERELARQSQERNDIRMPRPDATHTHSSHAPEEPVAASSPAGQAAPPSPAPAIPLDELPQSIVDEVACKDALLRTLYQLLPYDVEPLAVLDEDWRIARSTGSLSGTRNRVTYPLRYLHDDGAALTVTIRKTTRNASGKRWSLALIDGDDGTGTSHEAVGFEGLPAADEGAWSDLSGASTASAENPLRNLAQQVVLGTWESFLGTLAATATPERWNYPGEGVGKTSRYGVLRDYITSTFHRAQAQQRVAHSIDNSLATFDTGLTTPFGEDIFCCLGARSGDIPWQFSGFATVGSGELGGRLAATMADLPQPPSYITSLDDVIVNPERMVIIDHDAILSKQLGRLPRAFLNEQLEGNFAAEALLASGTALSAADVHDLSRILRADASAYRRMRRTLDDIVEQSLQRVRTSYRDAVPVYDPVDGRTKLLVPICLMQEGSVDRALVLDLQPSGAYRAATVLSLPRAYACARVVSKEQPEWLSAERVLS